MRYLMLLILLCLLMSGRVPVLAQDAPQNGPYLTFPHVFPNPTGHNGYEELMLAGDLIRYNAPLQAAMEPSAPLSLKRKALGEPDVQHALSLIQIAFTKPILSPRDPAKMSSETLFPDITIFRYLARFYNLMEYVALADGRTGAALDAMNDCLRLSRVVPADSIIGALVFVASDAIAVKTISQHISQLPFRDCERLQHLCEDWLGRTDSFAAALLSERGMETRIFDTYAPEPNILLNMSAAADDERHQPGPEELALQALIRDHPEELKKVWRQAQTDIGSFYDRLIVEVQKEAWERKPVEFPKEELPVKALTGFLVPAIQAVLDKQDQNRTNLHLLGTFAALQRYHWIYNAYPKSLRELHLPELTQDPFTGEPLLYKPDGAAYDLHSAGARDSDGKSRTPLYLPFRKSQ